MKEPARFMCMVMIMAMAVWQEALTAMKWAVTHGYITGISYAVPAPQGTAARAQAAAVSAGFCGETG